MRFGSQSSGSPVGSAVGTVSSAFGLANPILGLAGNILGGLFGRRGQEDANAANLAIAREQMAFQERMANTQYQRAASDLEAAGLNRVLALGSPAAAPSGASATMQNVDSALASGIEKGVSSAYAATKLRQDVKQSNANIKLTLDQAEKTRAEKDFISTQDANVKAATQKTIQERINLGLQAVGISTENQIKQLNRDIRRLEIPGVQSAAQFYAWLITSDEKNRSYYMQKVFGASWSGQLAKLLNHLFVGSDFKADFDSASGGRPNYTPVPEN
jgi:hypothetical protein